MVELHVEYQYLNCGTWNGKKLIASNRRWALTISSTQRNEDIDNTVEKNWNFSIDDVQRISTSPGQETGCKTSICGKRRVSNPLPGTVLAEADGRQVKICRSFNWADRTCYMLNTFLCDGERELKDAPGFSYFDLVDDYSKEKEFMISKQCESKGKCSNKCLKFKLFKTPLSWQEAHAACRTEQAFFGHAEELARPRNFDSPDEEGQHLRGVDRRPQSATASSITTTGALLQHNNTMWGSRPAQRQRRHPAVRTDDVRDGLPMERLRLLQTRGIRMPVRVVVKKKTFPISLEI
ncbi:c-type lectin domain-containing protein [Caerostris extrusa]|uniref:C-type lectin domain-containing protein n=1 Tax=Caerostris extrusa TaxID=172846 RepID=A0AAV4QV47_CAEEX|nr:c-type lectin domain-containing protein [Caerostris extrusa]